MKTIIATVTTKIIIAGIERLKMKSMKFKPTAEPIIMFGGSPTNVAVPPIFEEII